MCRAYYALMKDRGSGVTGNAAQTHDSEYICGVAGNAALTAFSQTLGSVSVHPGHFTKPGPGRNSATGQSHEEEKGAGSHWRRR
jgi:hypothetical protein